VPSGLICDHDLQIRIVKTHGIPQAFYLDKRDLFRATHTALAVGSAAVPAAGIGPAVATIHSMNGSSWSRSNARRIRTQFPGMVTSVMTG